MDNVVRLILMICNELFHPNHIVPLVKFVRTFMENADSFIAELFVKNERCHYADVHPRVQYKQCKR